MPVTIEKRLSRKTNKPYICLCVGGHPLTFDLLTILRITNISYDSIHELKVGDIIQVN